MESESVLDPLMDYRIYRILRMRILNPVTE